MSSHSDFITIADILKNLIKKNKVLTEAVVSEKLAKNWAQVAGQELAKYTEVVDYKNYTLIVNTVSSVWAQQLIFYQKMILEKYKELYPKIIIKTIQTRSTGKLNPPAETPKNVWEVCPVCGQQYAGTGRACFKCLQQITEKEERKILEYLAEAPWSRYQDIVQDFADVDEEYYHQLKERFKNQLYDKIKRGSYEIFNLPNIKTQQSLQKTALKYTMLRTGLTPEKINENIVRETIGKKVYAVIYSR